MWDKAISVKYSDPEELVVGASSGAALGRQIGCTFEGRVKGIGDGSQE